MNHLSGLLKSLVCTLGTAAALAGTAGAAEISVLSAGAIEPGLKAVVAAFEKQTGNTVQVAFNTAPELRKRISSHPAFDVVIAPPAVIGEFAAASKLAETRANVGRVGEIGFGAMTEILPYQDEGLKLVGPLPAGVQNYTAYTAAPLASSTQPALAQQFVTFLSGPGKPLLVAAGVTD